MHTLEDVKILKVFLLARSEIYTLEYLGQARKTEFLAMFLEDVEIFITLENV